MEIELPKMCINNLGDCNLPPTQIEELSSYQPYVFGAIPYETRFDDLEYAYKSIIEGGSLFEYAYENIMINKKESRGITARNVEFVGQGACQICQLCWFCDFAIAEISTLNPNVLAEIGLLWGFSKPVIITLNKNITEITKVPFDLKNQMLVLYSSIREMAPRLESKIKYLTKFLFRID